LVLHVRPVWVPLLHDTEIGNVRVDLHAEDGVQAGGRRRGHLHLNQDPVRVDRDPGDSRVVQPDREHRCIQCGLDLFGNAFQGVADCLIDEPFEHAFGVGQECFGCDQQRCGEDCSQHL
jgi:hypothetical protein